MQISHSKGFGQRARDLRRRVAVAIDHCMRRHIQCASRASGNATAITAELRAAGDARQYFVPAAALMASMSAPMSFPSVAALSYELDGARR